MTASRIDRRLLEGGVEFLPGGLALELEDALLGDGRQVPVFQSDRVEPPFPVLQGVAEVQPVRAGDGVADQLAQVPLPGHEADERDGPVRRLRLDQLRQLLPLLVDELEVGCVTGQPENQLVEEQNQTVVAETGGVLAEDATAPCPARGMPRRGPACCVS